MSHEFRTPLNAIPGMGYAEQTNATGASKERLSILVQSARNLSVLLDDILDMSAVQAGKLPIRPTVINLRSEVNAATALFRQQISDSNMQLRLDIDDRLPEYARIDGQRFRQCLSNLLSNTIKYAPQGSITLTMTAPTLRRMRRLPGLAAAVPVTADATDERRMFYLASGLDGYVCKPLSPELLSAAAMAVLSSA